MTDVIEKTMGSRRTHVAIVLDRSGSMESCRKATISGFNEYADQVRATAAAEGMETTLTLTVFNNTVETRQFLEPVSNLRDLTWETYQPDGSTAMLDAVGVTIERLARTLADRAHERVLVCIISDGYENASRAYTYEEIAKHISARTEAGWTFTYMGSNQDLSQVSAALHIPERNMASYDSDPEGTRDAWVRHARATSRSMSRDAVSASPDAPFYAPEERKGRSRQRKGE